MPEISAEPQGIHKIPNELLVKILAFVPFVRPGPLIRIASPPPLPHSSHSRLKLVDTRFRNTVASAALRLETVRCQFPELTALRNVTSISLAELNEYSLIEFKIRSAANLVTRDIDNEKARNAVYVSLHLLGYMSNIVGNARHDLTNAQLLTWTLRTYSPLNGFVPYGLPCIEYSSTCCRPWGTSGDLWAISGLII